MKVKRILLVLALGVIPGMVHAEGVQVWAQQLPPAVLSSSSAALTTVSVSSSPVGGVTVASANLGRLGLSIYNGPISTLYGSYGSSVNLDTSVTFVIPVSSTWTMPPPVYKGAITVWRSTGTGKVIVTELQ